MTARPSPDSRPALLARLAALRAAHPRPPRARDAAAALGVPEGALADARTLAGEAVALRRPEGPEGFAPLLDRLDALGALMALTRNESCVHERTGRYGRVRREGGRLRAEGGVSLAPEGLAVGFAVTEAGLRALQFFDASGEAVHKVYQAEGTDMARFEALVAEHADPSAPPAAFAPAPPAPAPAPPAGRRLAPGAARAALTRAAAEGASLAITVANRWAEQGRRGPVARIETVGPWLNVLDPTFNLHLREDHVAEARLTDEPLPALDLIDAAGLRVCRIAGDDGAADSAARWRALARDLATALGA